MNVLVTGASGFIGGHVAEALVAAGHAVTALVRPTSDRALLERLGVSFAVGDVTDLGSLERAMSGIDSVVHTAAVVSMYGPWEDYRRVGVAGTQNVVDAASGARVSRFVHVGSIAVYGFRHPSGVSLHEGMPLDLDPEPWNHYVREKALSEKIVWSAHEERRLAVTSIRPSVVVGPRDRNVVTRFMRMLDLPLNGTIGTGKNRVGLIVVQDLAELVVRALGADVAVGKAYNASGTETITQREIYALYAREAGKRLQPFFAPYPLAFAGTRLLEGVYRLAGRREEPPFAKIGVPIFGKDFTVDTELAARDLGFRATSSYEWAIRDSVRFYLDAERRRAS
ncbi:MAG TPA: NAD-dependent epimerase/dehydratase family protein [Polyangiaceae bacterium]|nr:NAD-dependent epimerase/dehydratase family protein [Polyangiaceae bacterium]